MGPTLWLVGMMGVGKSTVAPLVAAGLDRDWIDADTAIEHLSGRRIADLFAESEQTFREVEAEVVGDLAGADLVVACGGGVVTQPDLVQLMSETGCVIWLRATLKTLQVRIGDGRTRPLIAAEPAAALSRILDSRADQYRAAATAIIDTDDRLADHVAAEVVRKWNELSEE